MSTFTKLWNCHPTDELPCSTAGQRNFANQCAIRMGECFEKAGFATKHWQVRRCWQHKDDGGKGHVLAAEELARALNHAIIPGMKGVEKYSGKDGFEQIKIGAALFFSKIFMGPVCREIISICGMDGGFHLFGPLSAFTRRGEVVMTKARSGSGKPYDHGREDIDLYIRRRAQLLRGMAGVRSGPPFLYR